MRGRRRNLVVTVAAGILVASGATAMAVSVAAQTRAPQPPPSVTVPIVVERPEPTLPGPVATEDQAARQPPPAEVGVREPSVESAAGPSVVKFPVLASSEPVAIDIPSIGVESVLQQVGLTAENTVEVPAPGPHYNEAAWYRNSSTPGAPGPAIIVGHVDSAREGPSVFFKVGDLRPKDEVLITRADGVVAVFRVDTIGRYPKDEFPTQLVYGATDQAVLRLITCGGAFDEATGHYLENIVVFASLAASYSGSGEGTG